MVAEGTKGEEEKSGAANAAVFIHRCEGSHRMNRKDLGNTERGREASVPARLNATRTLLRELDEV